MVWPWHSHLREFYYRMTIMSRHTLLSRWRILEHETCGRNSSVKLSFLIHVICMHSLASHYKPSCLSPLTCITVTHFLSLHHHPTHDYTYQPIARLSHYTWLSKAPPDHPLICLDTMQTKPLIPLPIPMSSYTVGTHSLYPHLANVTPITSIIHLTHPQLVSLIPHLHPNLTTWPPRILSKPPLRA